MVQPFSSFWYDTINLGQSILESPLYISRDVSGYNFQKNIEIFFTFTNSVDPDFIWVHHSITIYKSTHLGVSRIQR